MWWGSCYRKVYGTGVNSYDCKKKFGSEGAYGERSVSK